MRTTGGSRRSLGTMGGKAESDDRTGGRQTRCYLRNLYAVLYVPARPARDATVTDRTTGRVLPVSRPWEPCEPESVGAHQPWTAHNAWNPSPQVQPHRPPPLAIRPSQPALALRRLQPTTADRAWLTQPWCRCCEQC